MLFRDLLFRPLMDFLYPSVCPSCGCRLTGEREFLCMDCHSTLPRVSGADALYRETAGRLCHDGLLDGVSTPYYFEKGCVLQTLIHELKYAGATRIGVMLGRDIGRSLQQPGDVKGFDVVIPIPLHRARARERGYNQSEFLCRGITEVTGARMTTSVLTRIRYTRTQTALSREEREENVLSAFRIDPRRAHLLYDASVLLVDDVITTGSTMRACARMLRMCGVKSVRAAAIAIAKQSTS